MKGYSWVSLTTLIILCSCATDNAIYHFPLPQNLNITPPSSDLPPEIRNFSGKWHGQWWMAGHPNELDVTLVVESVTASGALVLYSWGGSYNWDSRPGASRSVATFSRDEKGELLLSWTANNKRKFTYWLNEHGELEGRIKTTYGESVYITMKRIE